MPELKALMTQNEDFLQPLVQWLLQEVLEAEMNDSIGAAKSERTEGRQGLEFPRFCVLGCEEPNDSHEQQQQNRSPL